MTACHDRAARESAQIKDSNRCKEHHDARYDTSRRKLAKHAQGRAEATTDVTETEWTTALVIDQVDDRRISGGLSMRVGSCPAEAKMLASWIENVPSGVIGTVATVLGAKCLSCRTAIRRGQGREGSGHSQAVSDRRNDTAAAL